MVILTPSTIIALLLSIIQFVLVFAQDDNTIYERSSSPEIRVKQTVLVFASNATDTTAATFMLQAYGIPWKAVRVPKGGITLPVLNTTSSTGDLVGQYGLIVIISQVAYNYGTDTDQNWHSALTEDQWNDLYTYQSNFGVRMIQLNVYPNIDQHGAEALGGCCSVDEQTVSLNADVQSARFPQAGMNSVPLSTLGLWHYPAVIQSNNNITANTPFLTFAANVDYNSDSVGGVINTIGNRQQMVFFISFASWSVTSAYLSHIWIQWGTRGFYQGRRRAVLGTQVDDLLLPTEIYATGGRIYRVTPADLQWHADWTKNINSRLATTNPGSSYFLEFGYNGNGNLLASQIIDHKKKVCKLHPIVYTDTDYIETPLEFEKPLGTGMNVWPKKPSSFYDYSLACMQLDPLAAWVMQPANRDNFAYVTHTYTHLSLNNATYHDTYREIKWNKQYAATTGLSKAARFSGNGLIPPAITGLHNGDALKAFWDNGLRNAVGDNTRPVLRSPYSPHWPLITNVSENGFAGYWVTPRFATRIYYNCDTVNCTVGEWINTSKGASGDMSTLLAIEKASTSNQLLGLYHDPYMFHQANLRTSNISSTMVNGSQQTLSLIQTWVETIVAEFQRLVSWPLITLKHDDIAADFKSRRFQDRCLPRVTAQYSDDGTSIVGFTITANGNTCTVPIPVTVTGGLTSVPAGVTTEQIGNDPMTAWVTLKGSPVSLLLKEPINLQAL